MSGPGAGPAPVRRTWLELRSAGELVPARRPVEAVLVRAESPSPELNRYLYTAVGGDWYWVDRLAWSWAEWRDLLARPGYETWYATVGGTPAGYFELDATTPPDVEIVYFGLLPAFTGRGLGAWLLERAARRAFELGGRVQVSTCTLDGPAALPNYQARGFRMMREETHPAHRPARSPGPWPGARRPARGGPP